MSEESFKVSGRRNALPGTGTKSLSGSHHCTLRLRPGGWILAEHPDGTRQRLMLHESRGSFGASVGGKLWQGEITQARRQSVSGGAGADADLVAQFPGKVRKVLVEPGAQVKEGDPLT